LVNIVIYLFKQRSFHQSSFYLTKNYFSNPASSYKELFHQSSFKLHAHTNVSSIQLLLCKAYFHQSSFHFNLRACDMCKIVSVNILFTITSDLNNIDLH